jgi:hypothetical protein
MPGQLTVTQENVVRELVKLDNAGMLDEEFTFFRTFNGSRLEIPKASTSIECTEADLRALHSAGLVSVSFEGEHAAICALRPEAADAVRRDFGGSPRRRFLNALYDLADGKPLQPVLEVEIAKRAKLTIDELRPVYHVLSSERKVSHNSGSGQGPVMYLEAAGIREVQSGGHSPPAPGFRSTFINNLHLNASKSAVSVGDGNVATVNFSSPDSARALDDIREQGERLLLQHEAIRTALEDLTSAIRDGAAKDDSTFTGTLLKVAEASKSWAEFGSAVLGIINPSM